MEKSAQIIPKFIPEYDLDLLQGKPYDIYKWQCVHPDCTNACKLRQYPDLDVRYSVFHQDILPADLFVWMRKDPRYIVRWWHYYICSRHRKWHDQLPWGEREELFKNQESSTKFILTTKHHTDDPPGGKNSRYRLIEPIEKPLPKNRNRWQHP